MRRMKVRSLLLGMTCLCVGLCLFLGACGGAGDEGSDASSSSGADSGEPVSREFFAMDTYMTVTAYGERAAEATEAAEAEVTRLDALLSTGNADSEIARVNAGEGGELSEEAGALVQRGLDLYETTDHSFDIAIYPVMEAWGFTDKNYRVPSDEELADLLPLTDASKVSYDANSREVSFDRDGMAIDLGGIAKGYTSARIMEIYRDCGVSSGMVSLGGNVQVLGTKPDGSRWRVAIQNPASDGDAADGDAAEGDAAEGDADQPPYLGIFEAEDTAIITSGAYERNFTQDGVLYHHIIDPATGKPADSGLTSVTVVSEDGTLADALSTSLYIMGSDEAQEYWRAHRDQFDCILMDDAGELYVTEPIVEQFVSEDYPVNVIK